jgi:simple sugar transport system substrate-binding protein
MGRKKILVLVVLLSLMCLAACGTGSVPSEVGPATDVNPDLIVIGFSQVGAESDWRIANTKSMRETFTEEKGYRLLLKDAQQKKEAQIAAIREFIAQKVDYIVLAPSSETGWDEVLQEAKVADIPVILVDRMISTADSGLYTCWVGSDFRKEGEMAVNWMEKTFGTADELVVVHLQGSLGSSAQIGRTEGLDAGVQNHPGWNIVARESGDFTEVKGKEVMERLLKQYDRIDVLYCENDNMAFGAIAAMTAAKRTYGVNGATAIISFDATHAGLQATLAGEINYNVECNPLHGARVENIILQLEEGAAPDKEAYVDESEFDAATITQADIDARSY